MFFTPEWMVRVEVKQFDEFGWFSREFGLEFSGFREIDLQVQESDTLFRIDECVFKSGADCIHECYQGFKLGMGAQKIEENVINETFPKVDQVEEIYDYGAFLLAHAQIDIRGSYASSHGGAIDLVHMRVHEFEGAMFQDEVEYDKHYMGWWTVFGYQMLLFFHEVNHSCYAFFMWNVCVQGHNIRFDQDGIEWEGWEFFSEVEKMFCVFEV